LNNEKEGEDMVNRTWGRNKAQSFVPYGDSTALQRVNDTTVSTNQLAISGETVNFSAGAAGTTGVVALDVAPIYNATGSELGHYTSGSDNDTSFEWVTGTVLTTQVKWDDTLTDTQQLANLAQGEFALNHDTGKIRYCKKTTGTSDTCNYSTRMMNIDVTGSSITASQNLAQLNGNTISVNNGSVGTGVQRVTLADDGTGVIKVWDGTNTADVNTIQSGTNIRGDKGLTTASLLYGDTGSVSYPIWEADISSSSVAVGVEYGLGTLSFGWYSDGSNYYKLPAFNLDTMAGPEYNPGVSCRTAASGGSIEGTKVTDGTNYLVTMDAAARRGYVQLTDGTDSADVVQNVSTADNFDNQYGLVSSSILYARLNDTTVLPLRMATDAGFTSNMDGVSGLNVIASMYGRLSDSEVFPVGMTGSSGIAISTSQYSINTASAIFGYDAVGADMNAIEAHDLDTDGKSEEWALGVSLRTAAVGGSVEGTKLVDGTAAVSSSNPLHVTTVTTNKPGVTTATGLGAISTTTAISDNFKLNHVSVHLSATPTTSENIVVSIDANDGATYDVELDSVDLASEGAADYVFLPKSEIKLESGDEIKVAYTNTDGATFGLRIVTEKL